MLLKKVFMCHSARNIQSIEIPTTNIYNADGKINEEAIISILPSGFIDRPLFSVPLFIKSKGKEEIQRYSKHFRSVAIENYIGLALEIEYDA